MDLEFHAHAQTNARVCVCVCACVCLCVCVCARMCVNIQTLGTFVEITAYWIAGKDICLSLRNKTNLKKKKETTENGFKIKWRLLLYSFTVSITKKGKDPVDTSLVIFPVKPWGRHGHVWKCYCSRGFIPLPFDPGRCPLHSLSPHQAERRLRHEGGERHGSHRSIGYGFHV